MKVSVVVPTLNEEEFIAESLDSLRNQSLSCEIIVVDGGSMDRTVEIARGYADYVVELNRKGIGLAREVGVIVSSGDIIASADADTIYDRYWLENLAYKLSKGYVAVGGKILPRKKGLLESIFCSSLNFFARRGLLVGSNMAFTKQAWQAVNGYNIKLAKGEDWDLSLRLKRLGNIGFVEDAVCFTDTPINRKAEILSLFVATGLIPTKQPFFVGNSVGFFGTELAVTEVAEPSPIHHSHLGLAGLFITLAMKGKIQNETIRKGLAGFFSGIVWHHVATEDILDIKSLAWTLPLWLGLSYLNQ